MAESGSQNLAFPAFLTSALPPKADIELIGCRGAACDPKQTLVTDYRFVIQRLYLGHLNIDKAKPAERRGRKVTGPRFLREATDDSPKDPKIAVLPQAEFLRSRHA